MTRRLKVLVAMMRPLAESQRWWWAALGGFEAPIEKNRWLWRLKSKD